MADRPAALNRRDVTRDVFAASLGSVACCYTGQPFDTVKVRMQTNPAAFPTVLLASRSLLAREGAAALWKGAVPTAMGMVAENAMAFGVNEALKRTFPDEAQGDPTKRPDLVKPFLMVGAAGEWVVIAWLGNCNVAFSHLPSWTPLGRSSSRCLRPRERSRAAAPPPCCSRARSSRPRRRLSWAPRAPPPRTSTRK